MDIIGLLYEWVISILAVPFLAVVHAVLVPFFVILRLLEKTRMLLAGNMNRRASTLGCVVVTGAASGFGKILTKHLTDDLGVFVFACDVDSKVLFEQFAENRLVRPVVCDVTRSEDCRKVADIVKGHGRPLHALVNNAGVTGRPGTAFELPLANLRKVMDVNFFGPTVLVQELYPYLQQGPHPRIVMVSSVAGYMSGPGLGAYCASKHALEAWSDALRASIEVDVCHGKAVNVSIIEPFFAATNIYRELLNPDATFDYSVKKHRIEAGRAKFTADLESGKLMSAEYVVGFMVKALYDKYPQDRYVVTPNLVMRGLMALMAYMPNYFRLADRVKLQM